MQTLIEYTYINSTMLYDALITEVIQVFIENPVKFVNRIESAVKIKNLLAGNWKRCRQSNATQL